MLADLEASMAAWRRALDYLVDGLGFALAYQQVDATGYRLEYTRNGLGVRIDYRIRDAARVMIGRLDSDGQWPGAPGEIGPRTPINRVNLLDLEMVAGRTPTPVVWSIPDEAAIESYASSLREERALLLGDFSALERASALVRARARRAAEQKWGPEEAARRWR